MNRAKLAGLTVTGLAAAWITIAAQTTSRPVTFSEHVAPIIFANCVSCHRVGEAAPFPLMTYDEVKLRAKTIAAVTRVRYMPPWKADPGDVQFLGERRLTDAQIDTLQRWVDGGMEEGDPKKTPKAPTFTEGWPLGKPDLIVSMPEEFQVPASGPDVFRNFVLPLNLSRDQWVRAVDFRPSARKVVHHSLFFLDSSGAARELDQADPLPGFAGLMGGTGIVSGRLTPAQLIARARGDTTASANPQAAAGGRAGGAIGGWTPGGGPRTFPDDLAMFLPKGSDLIISTHFHPSGKPEREASTLALYFSEKAPTKAFFPLQLPPYVGAFKGINIPPGEANYTITDSFVLPIDVKAFSASAHAHYLAREVKLTATLPGGKVKTLLSISDWDLNWQGSYSFKDYFDLPAGTRIDATIRYDNSSANRRNPSNPPVRVTFGEQSTNEMGAVGLSVVAAKPGTLPRLRAAYEQHVNEAVLASPFLRGRGALQNAIQNRGRAR